MKVKLSRIECVKVGDDIRNLLNRTGLSEEGIKLIVSLSTQLEIVKKDVIESEQMPFNDKADLFLKEGNGAWRNFVKKHKKEFKEFMDMGGDPKSMPSSLIPEWEKIENPIKEKHKEGKTFVDEFHTNKTKFKNEEVEIILPYDGRKIDLIRQCTPSEWGSLELVFNKLDKTK